QTNRRSSRRRAHSLKWCSLPCRLSAGSPGSCGSARGCSSRRLEKLPVEPVQPILDRNPCDSGQVAEQDNDKRCHAEAKDGVRDCFAHAIVLSSDASAARHCRAMAAASRAISLGSTSCGGKWISTAWKRVA